MFEIITPSIGQLITNFPFLYITNSSEMNKEEILYITRTVNETNCAYEPFNIRKMNSKINSDPITTTRVRFPLVYFMTQKNVLW